MAKNEPAKKFGIKTAETIWQARKKCPDLVLLPAHHEKYNHYYHLINDIYQQYTDMVEPFSVDESWLDVTGSQKLFGTGPQIADEIRRRVKEELGLTLSVGVSFNKIFAKMGSNYKKPDATTVISRDNFRGLLWPLPVEEMFFVGFATAERLKSVGINTIGDLAKADGEALLGLLGKQGPVLSDYAAGLDESPVALFNYKSQIKSVGHGSTFKRDLLGKEDVTTALVGLSDRVAARLRRYQLKCSGVKVDIRDPSFNDISRQKQLNRPTDLAGEIKKAAMELIEGLWYFENPIRQITITGINLTNGDEGEQLSLFDDQGIIQTDLLESGNLEGNTGFGSSDSHIKAEAVERAMDDIRAKFGKSSITYGQILGNDIGIDI